MHAINEEPISSDAGCSCMVVRPSVEDPDVAVYIEHLESENRILQLQLLEKKVQETFFDGHSDGSSPDSEEADEGAVENVDDLDATQLQLLSLRRQLKREKRCSRMLRTSFTREIQTLWAWLDSSRTRHREQLLCLQKKLASLQRLPSKVEHSADSRVSTSSSEAHPLQNACEPSSVTQEAQMEDIDLQGNEATHEEKETSQSNNLTIKSHRFLSPNNDEKKFVATSIRDDISAPFDATTPSSAPHASPPTGKIVALLDADRITSVGSSKQENGEPCSNETAMKSLDAHEANSNKTIGTDLEKRNSPRHEKTPPALNSPSVQEHTEPRKEEEESVEEGQQESSGQDSNSPPAPTFYYKYSAPVKSDSEHATRSLIEQTSSRRENRRQLREALRLNKSGVVPPRATPPSIAHPRNPDSAIRLRGAQMRDPRPEDPLLPRQSNVNPNQIGEEISEELKDKRWYLRHALGLAFLRAVRGGGRTTDCATEEVAPLSNENLNMNPSSSSLSPDVPSSSWTSHEIVHASALMGVKSSSMQRAINETTHFFFRLSGNYPIFASELRSPILRLEEENNDPQLLESFDVAASPTDRKMENRDLERLGNSRLHNNGSPPVFISRTDCREDELRISFHAPVIFNQIRDFLRLPVDDFRDAVEHSTWRESLSPGKSGTSLIYFGDYVMKTLPESDYVMLTTKYLPAYAKYCEQRPYSLLTRFYAVVSVKWLKSGSSKCYVLMHNVFATRNYIHRIYDVKGSTVGRSAIQPGKEAPRTAFGALLLKDNDLPDQLLLCGSEARRLLLSQLRLDVDFLSSLSIVDYSMMIGVRSRVLSQDQQETLPSLKAGKESLTHGKIAKDLLSLRSCDGGLVSEPIKNEDEETVREEVYYLGVIDVLQEYNSTKKLENFAKGLYNDRSQISVIPPQEYADRLYRTIERISR